jgi:hypothetical protein
MAQQHTAADIVSMIRATKNGEFALSASEAELTVRLFASIAVGAAASDNVVLLSNRPKQPLGAGADEIGASA